MDFQDPMSLSTQIGDDIYIEDTLAQQEDFSMEEEIFNEMGRKQVRDMVNQLEEREKEILKFFKDTSITGYGSNSNYWRWKITFTEKELMNSVARNLPMVYRVRPRDVMTLSKGEWKSLPITAAAVGEVKDIEVAARGRSGVITYLLVTTNKNKFLVSKELNVRKLLTADKNSTKTNRTIPLYGQKVEVKVII